MKKSALLVALAFGVTSAFAQDLTSKKGEPYLPEAGDWSIGIDASPFLSYFGNMFNGTTGNAAPGWNHLNANNTIIGKMYTSETMAYRGILRLGFSSTKSVAEIGDQNATTPPTFPTLPAMVDDEMKSSSRFIGLGGGIEMRRGKTRLQGFYGGDAMIWMSGSKDTYTYGNTLDATHPVTAGNTTNFGTNITTDTYGNSARVTEMNNGSVFGFGVRGFIGAEYFVLPKLSIGGEFGWGLGIVSMKGASYDTESVGGSGPSVGTQEITGSKTSMMMVDVDRNAFGSGNATLRLNLHF